MTIRVAAPRCGVCTRASLLAAGLTRGAIDRRVRQGILRPTARGVYVVEGLSGPFTPLHRAVLAVPSSVLSHPSAGVVHRFTIDPDLGLDPAHVSIDADVRRRPVEGVVIHRRRVMPQGEDVVEVDGMAVTSPARTIVDLAAMIGPGRMRHLIQTQVGLGNPTAEELIACFQATARRGVKGIAMLRRVLSGMFDGLAAVDDGSMTQSALELAVAELLYAYRLGGFVPQYRPPWYDGRRGVVDFAHPELAVVLEADGRRWHRREQEMTEDRRRDRLAAAHGWVTLRVTWEEVTRRPAATAADIRAVLDARVSRFRQTG